MPNARVKRPGQVLQWWPEADRRLERLASVAEEVIAGITAAIFLHAGMRTSCVLRRQDGSVGDVEFRAVRPARQFLDGAAVEIARREIHVAKQAGGREHVVHQADALE